MTVSSTSLSIAAPPSVSASAKSSRCRLDFAMASLKFLAAPANLRRPVILGLCSLPALSSEKFLLSWL